MWLDDETKIKGRGVFTQTNEVAFFSNIHEIMEKIMTIVQDKKLSLQTTMTIVEQQNMPLGK